MSSLTINRMIVSLLLLIIGTILIAGCIAQTNGGNTTNTTQVSTMLPSGIATNISLFRYEVSTFIDDLFKKIRIHRNPSPTISATTTSEENTIDNGTYWIRIDPIVGYHLYHIGFNITAQTNLPVDENVLIRIYNATPWAKGYDGYNLIGYTKVTNGDIPYNKTSFHIKEKTLISAKYLVWMSAGEKGPSNVTHFEIVPTP